MGKNPSLVGNDLVCTFVPRSKTYLPAKRTFPQNVLLRLFSEVAEKDVRIRSRKNVYVSQETYTYVFLDVHIRVSGRAGTCYWIAIADEAAGRGRV
jgi:hypothetical protein